MRKPKLDLSDLGEFLVSVAIFLASVGPLAVFIVLGIMLIRLIESLL